MGFALGCMGMSMDDFCRCTPEEFEAVQRAWVDREEALVRDEWERMRLLACITIQPHVKKRLRPERLLPLRWDGRRGGGHGERRMSAEEQRRRFEAVVARIEGGDGYSA